MGLVTSMKSVTTIKSVTDKNRNVTVVTEATGFIDFTLRGKLQPSVSPACRRQGGQHLPLKGAPLNGKKERTKNS